jgi:hypothetical protein
MAMVAGLSGCASARIVQKDPNSVVVAIPENSDTWPSHYRPAAEAMAKQALGGPVVPVSEGEVITGGPNATGPTMSVAPGAKEYRITYQKKSMQQGIPITGPGLPPAPTMIGARPTTLPGAPVMGNGVQSTGGYAPGSMTGANTNAMPNTMVPTVNPSAPVSNYPYSTPASPYTVPGAPGMQPLPR